VLPVHGAATEAQHRRPFRRVIVHREEQWHSSAPSTPSSHVAGARGSAASACTHTCRTSRPSPARGRGAARRASRMPTQLQRRRDMRHHRSSSLHAARMAIHPRVLRPSPQPALCCIPPRVLRPFPCVASLPHTSRRHVAQPSVV
jgi:hypothetical protein